MVREGSVRASNTETSHSLRSVQHSFFFFLIYILFNSIVSLKTKRADLYNIFLFILSKYYLQNQVRQHF